MRILLLNQTAHIFSGSGAVVNNMKNILPTEDLLVLTEQSEASPDKLIDAEVIMEKPKLPAKGTRFFYWLTWFKVSGALEKALEKAKNFQPDVIVAVFPNEYFLYLGHLLAKKLDLPFVPWFHNTYAENRKGLDGIIGKIIQPKIFKSAASILSISDGLTEYYKKTYPKYQDKFETLQHGFEIKYFHDQKTLKNKPNIKFAFTGSLNSSCQEAAERLFRVIGKNSNYELNIFSGTSKRAFEKIMPPNANYIYHGFLPEESFDKAIRSCDIALVAHGFHGDIHPVEYQTIFPTRTIPLLSLGVPVLFHSPDYAAFTNFIEQRECGFLVKTTNEVEIQNTITEILNEPLLVQQKMNNALNTAAYFDINHTSKQFISLLEKTTSPKTTSQCVG